jgi:PAS domain S-box-containing protein
MQQTVMVSKNTDAPSAVISHSVRLTSKSLGLIVLLTVGGFVGNLLNVSLFFQVDFVFGSIAVLIVAGLFGPLWAGLAALVAGSATYLLWGHFYGTIIFVVEALLVGFLYRRQTKNLVLVDGLYWFVIGMPLVWFFHHTILEIESVASVLLMLKFAVNGIFNALLANILLVLVRWEQWTPETVRKARITVGHALFLLVLGLIFITALTLTILESRHEIHRIESLVTERLQRNARNLYSDLGMWHQQHVRAIEKVGAFAAGDISPQDLRDTLRIMAESFPGLIQIYITDARGSPLMVFEGEHATPLWEPPPSYLLEHLRAAQTHLRPALSDLVLTGEPDGELIQILTVPVILADQLRGWAVGEVRLEPLQRFVQRQATERDFDLTLLDSSSRVVASSIPTLAPGAATEWDQQSPPRAMGDDIFLLPPFRHQDLTPMRRWQESFYATEIPPNERVPWAMLLQLPVAPQETRLHQTYITNLGMVLILAGIAILLAQVLSRRFSAPLTNLARTTEALPANLLESRPIAWPESFVSEINLLIQNFRNMAAEIQGRTTELQSERATLEALLRQMPAGVMVAEIPSGRIMIANRQVQSILGSSLEGMEGVQDYGRFKAFWPDGTPMAPHELPLARSVQRGDTVREVEIQFLRKDGSYATLLASSDRIYDPEGKPIAAFVTFSDITERKIAERSLAAQNAILKQIAGGAPLIDSLNAVVGMVERELPGKVAAVFLLTRENRLSFCAGPGLPPDYVAAVDGLAVRKSSGCCGSAVALRELVVTPELGAEETWRSHPELHLEEHLRACWSLPIFSPAGEVLGTLALFHSERGAPQAPQLKLLETATHLAGIAIERVHAEQRQQREATVNTLRADISTAFTSPEEALQPILQNCAAALVRDLGTAAAAIWILDPATNVLQLEGCAIARPEFSSEKEFAQIGVHLLGRMDRLGGRYYTNDLQTDPVLAEPTRDLRHELRAAAICRISGERILGMVGVFSREKLEVDTLDILASVGWTIALGIERRRAEEALRRLNLELESRVEERTQAMKEIYSHMETFVHSVSHDLRAPLRGIQGFANILVEDYLDQLEPEARRLLERIANAAGRMDAMMRDLLEYSKLTRSNIQFHPVDLTTLLHEVVRDLEPDIAAAKGAVMTDEQFPEVMGNVALLKQIFFNLLTNALKYVRPNVRPAIRIRAEQDERHARIFVQDNGIGIEPQFQEKIFGLFDRLHPHGEYPGTGVGLAMVRKAVDRLGGRVGVQSEPGKGSCFWIELLKASPSQTTPASQPNNEP